MRIGTWNLAGRWDARHHELLLAMDCDVLLLTEVSERVDLAGHDWCGTSGRMAARRYWATIHARTPLSDVAEPHGASVMATTTGLRVCSSILPWRSCGSREPWVGHNTASRTEHAVDLVEHARPTIWGGDWNHAFSGTEGAGSVAGRRSIERAVSRLGLVVTTADCPHRLPGALSIDHIAVPTTWAAPAATRVVASHDGVRLSDHDAYVVDVEPLGPATGRQASGMSPKP